MMSPQSRGKSHPQSTKGHMCRKKETSDLNRPGFPSKRSGTDGLPLLNAVTREYSSSWVTAAVILWCCLIINPSCNCSLTYCYSISEHTRTTPLLFICLHLVRLIYLMFLLPNFDCGTASQRKALKCPTTLLCYACVIRQIKSDRNSRSELLGQPRTVNHISTKVVNKQQVYSILKTICISKY